MSASSEQQDGIAGAIVVVKRRREGKEAAAAREEPALVALADDVLLQILGRLEEDPRDWARASCASPRLAALLRGACFPPRLSRALPVELLPAPSADGAPAAWAALHKMSVCCPGLLRAGILLEPNDDFGLKLDIGPDLSVPAASSSSLKPTATSESRTAAVPAGSKTSFFTEPKHSEPPADDAAAWSLFRDDRLYICDWPGCVHAEERRKYMVFRGASTNRKRPNN